MNEALDGFTRIATGISIVFVVWGGVLALGYMLGSLLGRPGLTTAHRLAIGALAAIIGVALLAPSQARADDYRRAMEAADSWDYADAAAWLRSAAERGDVRAQERLGMMLVHGERLYGLALRGDPVEGREWLERAAAQGSETARYVLARAYGPPTALAARW